MQAPVTFGKFGFALDLSGEEVEALGWDLEALMDVESPLSVIEDVWDDAKLRRRYPGAIDKVGEHDAAVLLGRLTSLFGVVTLPEGEIEGMGFRAPLIVTRAGDKNLEAVGIALAYDSYASLRLAVVSLKDDDKVVEQIARDFWSLLLDDLDSLEDEDVRVFNREEGVWIVYGVTDGAPFYEEEEAEDEELEEYEEEPFGQERYDEDEGLDERDEY